LSIDLTPFKLSNYPAGETDCHQMLRFVFPNNEKKGLPGETGKAVPKDAFFNPAAKKGFLAYSTSGA